MSDFAVGFISGTIVAILGGNAILLYLNLSARREIEKKLGEAKWAAENAQQEITSTLEKLGVRAK